MKGRRVAVPAAAARIFKPLAAEARAQGVPLYAVGGPVRDWLLRKPSFDLDLAVPGDPGRVAAAAAKLLGGRVETFGRFGTRRIVSKGKFRVDVATTRVESYPEPACLPVVEKTGVPIELDLFRRDFTLNALAVRLDDGSNELVDAHGGAKDLEDRVLRVIHPASFRDDPTRVFRAARFLARLKAVPAPDMVDAARAAFSEGHAAKVSAHRLLHELECLLMEKDPGPAFVLLQAWGYLGLLHPRLPWNAEMPAGVEARLAALALSLGAAEGKAFVDSFPHPHERRALLHEALSLSFSDKAPRENPHPLAAAAARRLHPKLPPAALKACFVSGRDLIALGRKPGPDFHGVLDEAARLQRSGELKTRAAALSWLRKRSAGR